ncbi:hypothetical protein LTR94_036513, partial [Friedmanniomyces endolithicus]
MHQYPGRQAAQDKAVGHVGDQFQEDRPGRPVQRIETPGEEAGNQQQIGKGHRPERHLI